MMMPGDTTCITCSIVGPWPGLGTYTDSITISAQGAQGSPIIVPVTLSCVSSVVDITLNPINPPIMIPPGGGLFEFEATITNYDTIPRPFDVWIMVQLPNQSWYGPVLGPVSLTLPSGGSLTRERSQSVPAAAPAGQYWYEARVGIYPDSIYDASGFSFEKLPAGGDGSAGGDFIDWFCTGESFPGEIEDLQSLTSQLPTEFALLGAYPNPFNPLTTISFALPEDSRINLSVFDVTGRLVSTLVDGWREAGRHEVTFDGSYLASGVYLYTLNAGAHRATGKMVLMK
jgi:hypothetical protein